MTDEASPEAPPEAPAGPLVAVGVCTRRVFLTQAHVESLFGEGQVLTKLCDLSQPGEHACLQTVRVRGKAGALDEVRVVGPIVEQTRIELPLRDCERIGAGATLRLSRSLDGSQGCVLEGPEGTVVLADGVLNALRHLRVPPSFAASWGLAPDGRVAVRVEGERARVLQDVVVSVEDGAIPELVLDVEEAAAVDLGPDTAATLLLEDLPRG